MEHCVLAGITASPEGMCEVMLPKAVALFDPASARTTACACLPAAELSMGLLSASPVGAALEARKAAGEHDIMERAEQVRTGQQPRARRTAACVVAVKNAAVGTPDVCTAVLLRLHASVTV